MEQGQAESKPEAKASPPPERRPDALYQGGRVVGRVLEPEIDLQAKQVRFGEIFQSDGLLLPEECEFQKYRLMIQTVGWAARIDRVDPTKGRVLKEVVADLLGYTEQ
ncbi:MAG: hypothetical protein HYS33_10865 [Acidobacteria bacterium]|nr:hypothetical protein [Acidobacteriota bacterium]